MKLYRLMILGYQQNIERGVWADEMIRTDGTYHFRKYVEGLASEIVASYPIDKTIITNIETREAYEERRKSEEGIKDQVYPRKK